jgi:homogentisate 1,2-dioxygenase
MTEASIGQKETRELAVMVDTFYPVHLTKQAGELEKEEYMSTWLEGTGE